MIGSMVVTLPNRTSGMYSAQTTCAHDPVSVRLNAPCFDGHSAQRCNGASDETSMYQKIFKYLQLVQPAPGFRTVYRTMAHGERTRYHNRLGGQRRYIHHRHSKLMDFQVILIHRNIHNNRQPFLSWSCCSY